MQNTYTREEIIEALDTVLQDAKFAAAPQMSAFLKFVVHQTLDGNADRIKAYTVAVDGLGKPSTFDPQSDPSVRVLAKRLRDTLTAYYQRTTGHKLVLLLKSGSYVPSFVSVEFAEASQRQSNITHLSPVPVGGGMRDRGEASVRGIDDKRSFADRTTAQSSSMDNHFNVVTKIAKP